MPKGNPSLAAVLAAPDDDAPRLAYADEIANSDGPRAEFIRVQCAAARLPEGDATRAALGVRAEQLFRSAFPAWGKPFTLAGLNYAPSFPSYKRGFVESLAIDYVHPKIDVGHVLRLGPIHELRIDELKPVQARKVSRTPELRQLRRLVLTAHRGGWEPAVASPHLGELVELEVVAYNGEALSGGFAHARLPRLEKLTVAIGSFVIDELAVAAPLPALRSLTLPYSRIDDAGVRRLLAMPHLAGLDEIDLTNNPIAPAGVHLLRERFGTHVRCDDPAAARPSAPQTPAIPKNLGELRAAPRFPGWAGEVDSALVSAAAKLVDDALDALVALGPDAPLAQQRAVFQRCVQGFNRLDEQHHFIATIEAEDICAELDAARALTGLRDEEDLLHRWREF